MGMTHEEMNQGHEGNVKWEMVYEGGWGVACIYLSFFPLSLCIGEAGPAAEDTTEFGVSLSFSFFHILHLHHQRKASSAPERNGRGPMWSSSRIAYASWRFIAF